MSFTDNMEAANMKLSNAKYVYWTVSWLGDYKCYTEFER